MKKAGMSETEALHSERRLLPPRVGSLDLEAIGLSLEGRVRWPLSEEMGGEPGKIQRTTVWTIIVSQNEPLDDCFRRRV